LAARPEPYEHILRDMLSEYERRPRGWHVLVAKARGIGHDVFILKPEGTMTVLKVESLTVPKPIGIGIETAEGVERLRSIVGTERQPFGIRPIGQEAMHRVLRSMVQGTPPSFNVLVELLKKEPVPVSSITTPFVLEGPVGRLPTPLPSSHISPKHEELDLKLRKELERLVELKYGRPYTG